MDDKLKDQPAPSTMVPVTPLDTETVESPETLPVQPVPVALTVNTDVTVKKPTGGDTDVTVKEPAPKSEGQ